MESYKELRVLIIDDDPNTCQLMKNLLSSAGIDAESTTNPLSVLSRIKKESFDIFLVDVYMPEMSGLELLPHIVRNCPQSKAIVVSSSSDNDVALSAIRLGAFDFINKPFPTELLIYIVKRAAEVVGAEKAKAELAEELRVNESAILNYKGKIERLSKQLTETNHALAVVAKNIEQAKEETENRIARKLRSEIVPVIERLCGDNSIAENGKQLDVLVNHMIQDLTTGFITDAWITSALSATELRIASMIKNGLTTDEISEHLHIAPSTVRTHRKNIRRKLKIRNASYSLRNYLISRSRKARNTY